MSKPHEHEWKKDEHRAGVINVTDAITLECKVAFWRIPGGDVEALRQANETVALALAAPEMARALLAIRDRMTEAGKALPVTRSAEEVAAREMDVTMPAAVLREVLAALKKAGAM